MLDGSYFARVLALQSSHCNRNSQQHCNCTSPALVGTCRHYIGAALVLRKFYTGSARLPRCFVSGPVSMIATRNGSGPPPILPGASTALVLFRYCNSAARPLLVVYTCCTDTALVLYSLFWYCGRHSGLRKYCTSLPVLEYCCTGMKLVLHDSSGRVLVLHPSSELHWHCASTTLARYRDNTTLVMPWCSSGTALMLHECNTGTSLVLQWPSYQNWSCTGAALSASMLRLQCRSNTPAMPDKIQYFAKIRPDPSPERSFRNDSPDDQRSTLRSAPKRASG